MPFFAVPYRTKFRRIKVPKIRFCAENFVRRNILSAECFVRRKSLFQPHLMIENLIEKRITVKYNSKPRLDGQTYSADKSAEIST